MLYNTIQFITFITYGYMANKTTIEDFVDVVCAIFRLITHSNFSGNLEILLEQGKSKTNTNNYIHLFIK